MLSIDEQQKLQKLLGMISEDIQKGPDVSNRLRDQEGKFLPNPSESQEEEEFRLRSIRLVKVRGSYGTYLVRDWETVERVVGFLLMLGSIIILSRIF